MGLVQCLVIVSWFYAQLVLTFPLEDEAPTYSLNGKECKMCPAGTYTTACSECESCPAGYFTPHWNSEDSCHPCYADCKPAFHMKVKQNCTSKTDVKCGCEDGFRCTDEVTFSQDICRYCEKIQQITNDAATVTAGKDKHTPSSASSGRSSTSAKHCKFPNCGSQSVPPARNGTRPYGDAATVTAGKDKHTPSSASSGRSSTSAKHCKFPNCGSQSVPPARNGTRPYGDNTSSQLAAILCPVVIVGCVALVILFCVRRSPGDETCFKQAIAKLCNEGGRDVSHKPKESTQFPRDSFGAKQQPSSVSAANLGPVHVYNPGTVIFSALSQFKGQVGPTIECSNTAERVNSEEEEDERDCPVFHPTSSPSIHLSEEEKSGETDSIFFPSQEQGKDFHVSKEESL